MSENNVIHITTTSGWDDYALLDSGNGRRLERFGAYTLSRPDPQVLWQPMKDIAIWQHTDAIFDEQKDRRDNWKTQKPLPAKWQMTYKHISFYAKLSPFKHTGVFPEQAAQWDLLARAITQAKRQVNVLNLFAYTGIASLVAAAAGAEVTHVDASSSAISWGKENQALSKLTEKPIRWILDDAMKFVARELRRGKTYDIILMDPPIYGHGPDHEVWDFDKHFPQLVQLCSLLLSDNPLLFLVNAYAISASSLMLGNVLSGFLPAHGTLTSGELALSESESDRLLSTGIYSMWEAGRE